MLIQHKKMARPCTSPDHNYVYHFHSPGLEPWIAGIIKGSKIALKNVLDVGCGLGFWGFLIKAHISNDTYVVGVDISKAKLKKLKSLRIYDALICGDASHLSLRRDTFSLIISIAMLHIIQTAKEVVKHIESYATPNGLIVLADGLADKDLVNYLLCLGYEVLAYYLRGYCLVRINDGKAIPLYRNFTCKIICQIFSITYRLLKLRFVSHVIVFKMKSC